MPQPEDAPTYWAHETAILDAGARVGAGTKIWHWSHVHSQAVIGERCSLGQNVYVGKAIIGSNVKIQNNVSVYDAVVLEDDVFCGPSIVFTNVINPRSHVVRKHEYRETLVRRGATIGANAVVVCGNTIGRYAMIGAGAVVTHDVADYALVLGNPARHAGWVCQCGTRLSFEAGASECRSCHTRYVLQDEVCSPVSPAE